MKVPLNWLRDYVAIDIPVPELVERLTLAGLEVTGAKLFGLPHPEGLRVKQEEKGPVWDRDKIVIGQILKTEKHPNADKLKLVTVEYGAKEPKVVVTGAPNISAGDAGQKVILALTGSVLFDGHAQPKKLTELKPAKIRGVPSDAMVCSAFELGISDEHEGVILLGDDAPVGTPLADYLGDVVLEIDVLPNMARCLALIGVAREVAALTGGKARPPAAEFRPLAEKIDGQVSVSIADPSLSRRYAALLVRGVTVGPSPSRVQYRLTYAGMRPINNIVDVTNYVMLEWGQPLHAFDYDVLLRRAGGKPPAIVVRPAREGEKLVTLDGVERKLTPQNLLIADSAGPIALAGVMGGLETEVTEKTKNVLLESANFDFVSVRRTARAFDLPSEASARFSRGIHPETVKPAALRAAQLMAEYAGGQVVDGIADAYPAPLPPQTVTLRASEIRRSLGTDLPAPEVERILTALEFKVEPEAEGVWRVTTPPHRTDIQEGEADLIEELARVHGYDRLPETLLAAELPEQRDNRDLMNEEQTRDLLANAGLQEVVTYSLTTPEREAPLRMSQEEYAELLRLAPHEREQMLRERFEYVRLLNPISAERTVMRQVLLPGVLDVAAANLRHTDTVKLFEAGPVYIPKAGEKLPDEPRRLAVVLTGRRLPPAWDDPLDQKPAKLDFFDLKGVIEELAEGLHLGTGCRATRAVPYLHPGRAAELVLGDRPVGVFGELHPKTAEAFGLGDRAVLVAELDLDAILAAIPERSPYVPVPRFPAALRDVAVIVDEGVPAERVAAELRAGGGELLRAARLFDVYQGPSIPPGKKSLAYALTYQAEDRTLTDKEVDKVHKKIEDRLVHVLKAQIRGKEGGPGA